MNGLTVSSMKDVLLHEYGPNNTSKSRHFKPLPAIKTGKISKEKELNDILSKVQNDIAQIKKDVLSSLASGGTVDYNKIKTLFEQAEKEIQEKKGDVVCRYNNQAATLPSSSVTLKENSSSGRNTKSLNVDERPILSPVDRGYIEKVSKIKEASPGQKILALQKLKSIINPARPDARSLLNRHYGVPLPSSGLDHEKEMLKASRPVTATTISQSTRAPAANRMDGRVTPPPLTVNDARKGVLNLIERKLIPAASQLSINPSPVKQKKVVLHEPLDMKQYKQDLAMTRPQYNVALVKFDEHSLNTAVDQRCKRIATSNSGDRFLGKGGQNPSCEELFQANSNETQISLYEPTTTSDFNRVLAPLPTPALDLIHQTQSHKFVIQNGFIRTNAQDFIHFKQFYCLSWGNISSLLQKVEKLMADYCVPIAFIDGDRLADLALFFEVGPKPTIKDLLMCVLNSEDVQTIILIPGRRYTANDGVEKAAIKIQASWRGYQKHSAYSEYRRKKWSAGIIALSWIMKCKMAMVRTVLKQNKLRYLQNFRVRAKNFKEKWPILKSSKRVIIHIPSLGYDASIREEMDNIATLQNKQIGRICDIRDPNVEVIYICPVKINDELNDYYIKLLQVMSNITGQDHELIKTKLKILTPTHHNRFPAHNLCLSTLLKYSIDLMQRLKTLITGKQAYIVPGMMHDDDLYIANYLDVPILGTEPEIAHLYSMKSGVRRIFESSCVSKPPGEYDVHNIEQVYTSLARLQTENLDVTRWLFKIDNQNDGCGTAYCDVAPYMSCYEYVLKEQERYGEKWKKIWAHENAYNIILKEIPKILDQYGTPVNRSLFSSWGEFLNSFLRQGGIIEACPPSKSVTGLTANLLIEPDGKMEILSVSDQIHSASEYKCWGCTVPQSSIDPEVVNTAILSIGGACKERGIVGYCSIDFVTFIDPKNDHQELWAVGLNLSYSDSYAMIRLMTVLTNGYYDTTKNTFEVMVNKNAPVNVAYQSKRKKSGTSGEVCQRRPRFCVLSSHVFHTNLNNIHYSVFFQMCKAHGIGYDDKLKVGTVFTLIDHIRRESMGILTLGETLQQAVSSCAINLSMIHNEISSPIMQGNSNFKGALKDLKSILESLSVNMKINQNAYPTSNPVEMQRQIKSAESTKSVTSKGSDRQSKSANSSDFEKKTVTGKNNQFVIWNGESFVPKTKSAPGQLVEVDMVTNSGYVNDNRYPSSPISMTQSDKHM